jgi:TRAP-type uncharacterized transport system fused permease subunit
MVVGLYVAATVVTLMQLLRRHERRLLPLLALFACLAVARALGPWSAWASAFEVAGIGAGLVLLAMLTPRHTAVR